MHVFISWAYLSTAEEADEQRKAWLAKSQESELAEDKAFAETLVQKNCLPEFFTYNELVASKETASTKLDEINSDILAIRFIVPGLSEIKTYKLSGRLDGSKLPVCLAARAFLLNNFVGEWTSDLNAPGFNKITFVGLPGLNDFLKKLAFACGAFGESLPVDLWCKTQKIEIAKEDKEVRQLIEACAFNQKQPEEKQKYKNLLTGWLGTGTSAERDGDLLIAAALKLGFVKPISRN
jgi:hypothetical protein